MQIEQIGIGQLHWSTANYAPLQEKALWDGLVAMYDKVTMDLFLPIIYLKYTNFIPWLVRILLMLRFLNRNLGPKGLTLTMSHHLP